MLWKLWKNSLILLLGLISMLIVITSCSNPYYIGRNGINQCSGISLKMLFKKGFENTDNQKGYTFMLKIWEK